MASVTLWPYSAEILFLFRVCRGLRAAPNALSRIESLPKAASLLRNDSKMPFASHKDRHEKIGQGTIGLDAIVRIVNHKKLKELPFILETPNDLAGWAQEIKLLRAATF